MTDKARLMAKLRAVANELAAEFGYKEATAAMDQVKKEISEAAWGDNR